MTRSSPMSEYERRPIIDVLEELAGVIEAVRGDRDVIRVSGLRGDAQDVAFIGIDGLQEIIRRACEALNARSSAGIESAEVQDTYLVGGPDLKAMSGSVESDRVIQLHFRRKATDADRKWLLEAINAKIAADKAGVGDVAQPSAGTSEPVAYRWRQPGNKHWIYDPTPEWIEDHKHEIELEPLFNGVAQAASDPYRDTVRKIAAAREKRMAELRECLESIAGMRTDEPREPDDADWRFRCLSAVEAAKNTLALSSTPSATPCEHEAIICLDGMWHCQKCGDAIDVAVAQPSPHGGTTNE